MKKTSAEDEIEKLLGLMAPAPPAPELMARLRAARPDSLGKVTCFPLPRWIPLAAAACIAITVGLVSRPGPSVKRQAVNSLSPASPPLVPLESRQHLMTVSDLGIVEDRHQQPVRLIGTTWVDEIVYAYGTNGKRVTESRIRQEVLPVSLKTY